MMEQIKVYSFYLFLTYECMCVKDYNKIYEIQYLMTHSQIEFILNRTDEHKQSR